MKILICPSGFKESLEPQQVADCIEMGIKQVVPEVQVKKVPLFDGGEGFAQALVDATNGVVKYLPTMGPTGESVASHYGFLGGVSKRTAVVEMAATAGLGLVPKGLRDQTITTTYGVGQLIFDALEEGAEHVLVGCGDSGTSDGGAGMCQALGVRFLDSDGTELPHAAGGGSLLDVADIDLSGLHPRLKDVAIEVACNWENVLCGPRGVAFVYGPQKGATEEQVQVLDTALSTYAAAVGRELGKDVSRSPGSGASGGLGAGMMLIGATLRPRYDVVADYFGMANLFDGCQLVFTAEGGIDLQTPQGKIPSEVGRRAKKLGLPVIALAGTVGRGAKVTYKTGIDAFTSILQGPATLDEAIKGAKPLLTDCAESAMRMVMIGWSLRSTLSSTLSN